MSAGFVEGDALEEAVDELVDAGLRGAAVGKSAAVVVDGGVERLLEVAAVVGEPAGVDEGLLLDVGVVGVAAVLGEGDGEALHALEQRVGEDADALGVDLALEDLRP